MDNFSKQKIIYPDITSSFPFYLDKDGFYLLGSAFMITGDHLGFLTAFFNSSLFKYCFSEHFPKRLKPKRVKKIIPVK